VDAYVDLVHNTGNFLKEVLPPDEALERVQKEVKGLFDPQVVKLLAEYVQGEVAQAKLPDASPLVLIADPDPKATSKVELKLVKEGFKVRVARDSLSAQECIAEESVAAVITEMRLEPEDGFEILEEISRRGLEVPVVMIASEPPPEAITRAFDAGVFDFITKPYVPEVLTAKLQKEIEKSKAAPPSEPPKVMDKSEDVIVTEPPPAESPEDELTTEAEITIEVDDGTPSEEDEPLPQHRSDSFADVGGSKNRIFAGTLEGKFAYSLIRALVSKRRTGLLVLRSGDDRGEIFFNKGYVFNAELEDLSQEESFLKMAAWRDCLYRFDMDAQPTARNMKTPTPMLLKIAIPSREK
jgi:DNA-binding response OmpR family regulator